ncbi:flagellar protein FlgN [Roseobacter sp. YSTF-M11]|uniref:Flagellar protein FlgN n=1 Tax=Roseobacter insulae TaxID=2859783 RepID=A0A9X1FT49_9RHOB|nr:flagellar protein FlgN [Roseobacter insulae]MBW4706967.1 flagellar protein FlgN [Roseobacter insulae]
MAHEEFDGVMEALDDVLDAERTALLNGNLDEVGRLLERKETLIDQLAELEDGARDPLEALNTKIKRNQLLLDHALEGIRSVARRLATLRRVRSSLDTYDEHGTRQTIDMTADGVVEKRA